MGRIKHIEIAGIDGAGLRAFYAGLFGWSIERQDMGGFDYYSIQTGTEPTAGIRDEPDGKAELVVYYEVADLDAAYKAALELGASSRIPPMTYGELRFALVSDPEGNAVGLTEAPA